MYAWHPIKGPLANSVDPDQTPQNARISTINDNKNRKDTPSIRYGPVQRKRKKSPLGIRSNELMANMSELQKKIFEPGHSIFYKIACAPSEEPVHPHRLIRIFVVCLNPVSILCKSISGRHRPVRVADGPMTARCRFT